VGVPATLIEGDNGVYDVVVDGKTIFSKHEAGRFPETSEILAMLPR
jgi:selenoprotein W-related protein